jgi:hypothetical protein
MNLFLNSSTIDLIIKVARYTSLAVTIYKLAKGKKTFKSPLLQYLFYLFVFFQSGKAILSAIRMLKPFITSIFELYYS